MMGLEENFGWGTWNSIAESHEAPDMTDFGWQDTNHQHFYGEKQGTTSHVPLLALLAQQ